MEVHAEAFWLQKNGSSEVEYEDAFGPPTLRTPQGLRADSLRFAVADGATEASFSKQWATQIVRAFVQGRLTVDPTPEQLKPLQARWQQSVHRHPLPWYAEEKAAKGAFCALLGLELSESADAKTPLLAWRAVAVGDCCLFQVEQEQVVKAWPITTSAEFGNTPSLLSSNAANNGDGLAAATVMRAEGTCTQQTAFYLMTDALSCWFLREHERGNHPWRLITDLGTDAAPTFPTLIGNLRTAGEIKNDDVTLLRIDVLG